jgi:putative SOS response-associated peptidase YedK
MQLPRRLRKLPPQGETICERFTQNYTWAVVSHSCFLPDFETTGGTILSCTIIVRAASKWIETYHDHMPVILD